MKKALISIFFAIYSSLAIAESSVKEINQDIREFQQFFKERFPSVSLEQYNEGVNALPQYAGHRLNWKLLLELPPYEMLMIKAKTAWNAELSSGITLAECFESKPTVGAYPYFLEGTVQTIIGDINRCLQDNGETALDSMSEDIALLEAAFKIQNGEQEIEIDYGESEMRRLYDLGRTYFWTKRGQQNLSCADCHVHNAGNQLRGDVLSAALGHGAGSPTYSVAGALQNKPMVSLHRRYAQCNVMVGAVPLSAQSETYIGLEIYQAIMNRGITIKVPSLRP